MWSGLLIAHCALKFFIPNSSFFIKQSVYMLLTGYFGVWFGAMLVSTLLFAARRGAAPTPLPAPLPRVSILIAARDEEAAIGRCLTAIRALDYPAELVEVLLGDDGSTDRTRALA